MSCVVFRDLAGRLTEIGAELRHVRLEWLVRRTPVDQALGSSIPCIVSQLTKALNQPVLVVSLGYMPKP